MFKNTLRHLAASLAILAATATANAALVNGTGNLVAPGVYFGTGNVDGNWTGDTANNIEVALRAKNRATLATITPDANGVYHAATGLCNPICSGGDKAMWNYEFSVNTNANGGAVERDLTSVFVRFMIDIDPTVSTNFVTINGLGNWGDNDYWSGIKRHADGMNPLDDMPLVGEFGAQQSANPMFGNSGFNFLPGEGLYDIRMTVWGGDPQGQRSPLATTSIQVQVGENIPVPEPASLALALFAIAGIGATRRKKVQGVVAS